MTLTCSNCGQAMPDNSPYTPIEVRDAVLEAALDWENVRYQFTRSVNTIKDHRIVLRGKPVTMTVVEYIEPVDMPGNEYDRQGETYKAYLVLKVGETHYRMEAHVDSYAEEIWGGPLIRVNRVEKIVQVWE